MRIIIIGVMVFSAALMAGCCPHAKPPLAPPPAISLEDQLGQLNNRAMALANLKGHGKVTVSYFDAQGKKHTHDADGSLQLRQHFDDANNPADMLLLGRVVGQDAFEAGMNRTNYWMAVRLDAKQALVGIVANMAHVPVGAMPLRADRMVELLAITPLHDNPQQHISMLVNDQNATNEIYVTRTFADGRSCLERMIEVDRRSGNVDQVRLYNPDGTLLARADLAKYRPIGAYGSYGHYDPMLFPMRIVIEYPERNSDHAARVILDLSDMAMVPPIPDSRFAMPDFEQQGLKVVDVDEPGSK